MAIPGKRSLIQNYQIIINNLICLLSSAYAAFGLPTTDHLCHQREYRMSFDCQQKNLRISWLKNKSVQLETYLRQTHNKIVSIGVLCRCYDLFFRGVVFAKFDILLYRGSEEDRLLVHNANLTAKPVEVEVAKIFVVHIDGSIERIVKTLNELYASRFTTTYSVSAKFEWIDRNDNKSCVWNEKCYLSFQLRRPLNRLRFSYTSRWEF